MGNGCVNVCWRGVGAEGGKKVKVLKRIKPTSRAYSAVTTHTHKLTIHSMQKSSNHELAVQNIFMLHFYSLSIFRKS